MDSCLSFLLATGAAFLSVQSQVVTSTTAVGRSLGGGTVEDVSQGLSRYGHRGPPCLSLGSING